MLFAAMNGMNRVNLCRKIAAIFAQGVNSRVDRFCVGAEFMAGASRAGAASG
jgi:hypothetical protein